YMFDKKGSILIDKKNIDEEKLMDLALEAGAEDVLEEENEFQVLTAPDDFNTVREKLEEDGVSFIEATLSMIPQNTAEIAEEKVAIRLMKLMDVLEECDDVQDVHANFDIPDEIMEKIS
ncbi:MAG: YebC/PmpR family DNA-binding transcriptional regulator, partial [Desulfobulbaceae bacterium]|nr:YebC/PmpR family DNA-binding transcriptional regulator [Desulfobulbaceae bacterium]